VTRMLKIVSKACPTPCVCCQLDRSAKGRRETYQCHLACCVRYTVPSFVISRDSLPGLNCTRAGDVTVILSFLDCFHYGGDRCRRRGVKSGGITKAEVDGAFRVDRSDSHQFR